MADSEVIRFAGDVSIDKIEIISATGYGMEVSNQVVALEIYEDLFSPFISGVLAFCCNEVSVSVIFLLKIL